eukprot:269259_1
MSVKVVRNIAYIHNKKPSSQQLAAARKNGKAIFKTIIIPLIIGPHITNNQWCLSVSHYDQQNATDVPVQSLLNENNKATRSLHDIILQHGVYWNQAYRNWFQQHSTLLPIKYAVGDSIYDYNDEIYVQLAYVACNQYRLCFTDGGTNKFYEHNACLYGGQEIDVEKSEESHHLHLTGKRLYVSNASEIVSSNSDIELLRVCKIISHRSYISTIRNIYLNVKKIKTFSLRINKYGIEKQFGPVKLSKNTFVPHIKRLLRSKEYEFKETKKDLWFVLTYREADNMFYKEDWNPFHKIIQQEKVFGHSIQWIYAKKAEALTVKYYILQQDIEGKTAIKGTGILKK